MSELNKTEVQKKPDNRVLFDLEEIKTIVAGASLMADGLFLICETEGCPTDLDSARELFEERMNYAIGKLDNLMNSLQAVRD